MITVCQILVVQSNVPILYNIHISLTRLIPLYFKSTYFVSLITVQLSYWYKFPDCYESLNFLSPRYQEGPSVTSIIFVHVKLYFEVRMCDALCHSINHLITVIKT